VEKKETAAWSHWSRRSFLRTLGVAVPLLSLVGESSHMEDWYRYLNCGYRLPAVGDTDKMGAYEAVGANRCYVYGAMRSSLLPSGQKPVRKGNTFMTSGPFLLQRKGPSRVSVIVSRTFCRVCE
jgi:hypothetical protein